MKEVYNALLIIGIVLGGLVIALGLFALYQKNKESAKHSS